MRPRVVRPWYVQLAVVVAAFAIELLVAFVAYRIRVGRLDAVLAYMNGDLRFRVKVAEGTANMMGMDAVFIITTMACATLATYLSRNIWTGIVTGLLSSVPQTLMNIGVANYIRHSADLLSFAATNQDKLLSARQYGFQAFSATFLPTAIAVTVGYFWGRAATDRQLRVEHPIVIAGRSEEEKAKAREAQARAQARGTTLVPPAAQSEGAAPAAAPAPAPAAVAAVPAAPAPAAPAPAPAAAAPAAPAVAAAVAPAAAARDTLPHARPERVAIPCPLCGAFNAPINAACISCGAHLA